MACELITAPTGGAPLSDTDYNAQNLYILALLASMDVKQLHLTQWNTLNEPKIKEDIYIQHGGALFQQKDENYDITGAPANGRVYIKVTRTGNELDFAFVNSAAGYSWNYIYNGFYHADGTQLLPYLIYNNGGNYSKFEHNCFDNKYVITSSVRRSGTIEIGQWDMTGVHALNINHSIDLWRFLRIKAIFIQSDLQNDSYILNTMRDIADPALLAGGMYGITSTQIQLRNRTGGAFDTVAFDNNPVTQRGWIEYEIAIPE